MPNKTLRLSWGIAPILLICWGAFAAVSKLILKDIEPLQLHFYLFAISLAFMLLLVPSRNHLRLMVRTGVRGLLRTGVIGLWSYAYYACYTGALKWIPATEAMMLNYLFPVFIVVLAVLVGKEKMNASKCLMIVSALLGAFVMLSNGAGFHLTNWGGDLLALGAAFSWGMFSVLGKRNPVPIFVSLFMYVLVGFLCSFVALVSFSDWPHPDRGTWTGMIWLSLSNIVAGYFLWFRLLRISSTALAAALSFLAPFVTLTFIVLLLGETITGYQLGGFLWILLSVFVYTWWERLQSVRITTGSTHS